ncbi:MAG TPA: hypothetical protein VI112_18060 [Bacteroidia bacterium]
MNSITKTKFEWAGEYYAGPVNPKALFKVVGYINDHEEHHRKQGFVQGPGSSTPNKLT